MDELIILGAGPHAFEMADIVQQINHSALTWNFRGFLVPDEQVNRIGEQSPQGYRILGTYGDIERYSGVWFVPEYNCGYPEVPEDKLASLIAPSAFIASSASIGKGTVVYPNCFVGHQAVLGERNFVLSGSVINHDDVLENDVTICSGVTVAGSVYIEQGCYLGQACTVKQHIHIGKHSLIGMGCVVIRDVLPNSVMVGNPASNLRVNKGA